LFDRKMLSDPQLVETHKLRKMTSIICFDLHFRIAVEGLTRISLRAITAASALYCGFAQPNPAHQ
jgi:hypothetical protein